MNGSCPATRQPTLLGGLLGALSLCGIAMAQATPALPDDPSPAQVVIVPGTAASELRSYRRFLPGVREFNAYHHLAPQAQLRFGLVTGSFPMKPLKLTRAVMESRSWFDSWSEPLTVLEDGWFLIPDSAEAERRNADVVVSRRNGARAKWVIDVHTPGLPAQVYRLGDLRLECRVYLAIEWAVWHGKLVMGKKANASTPPMDFACSGNTSVFFNTRPWPRLQAYVIREGDRQVRRELNGQAINRDSFLLNLGTDTSLQNWSDDALVEFVFYDDSHWGQAVQVSEK